jgi:hypothetical protein
MIAAGSSGEILIKSLGFFRGLGIIRRRRRRRRRK